MMCLEIIAALSAYIGDNIIAFIPWAPSAAICFSLCMTWALSAFTTSAWLAIITTSALSALMQCSICCLWIFFFISIQCFHVISNKCFVTFANKKQTNQQDITNENSNRFFSLAYRSLTCMALVSWIVAKVNSMVLEGLHPQLSTKLTFAPPHRLPHIHPSATIGFGTLNCHMPPQHALILLLLGCFGFVGFLLGRLLGYLLLHGWLLVGSTCLGNHGSEICCSGLGFFTYNRLEMAAAFEID